MAKSKLAPFPLRVAHFCPPDIWAPWSPWFNLPSTWLAIAGCTKRSLTHLSSFFVEIISMSPCNHLESRAASECRVSSCKSCPFLGYRRAFNYSVLFHINIPAHPQDCDSYFMIKPNKHIGLEIHSSMFKMEIWQKRDRSMDGDISTLSIQRTCLHVISRHHDKHLMVFESIHPNHCLRDTKSVRRQKTLFRNQSEAAFVGDLC